MRHCRLCFLIDLKFPRMQMSCLCRWGCVCPFGALLVGVCALQRPGLVADASGGRCLHQA